MARETALTATPAISQQQRRVENELVRTVLASSDSTPRPAWSLAALVRALTLRVTPRQLSMSGKARTAAPGSGCIS